MTNTVWQQSQKTRRVPHLAGGLQNYFDSDTPDATAAPPPDDLAREIADSNIPPLVAQPAPVNDLGGISAYNVVPLGPDDYVPAEPPPPTAGGAPSGAFAPAPASPPSSPFAPPTAPPPSAAIPYSDALTEQEKLSGQYPIMQAPKWWQRVIAGGAGALAGWSNAAGRTRNPVNIAAVQDAIEHPGYAEKLEEWRSRVIPAQTKAEIESKRFGAQVEQQKLANETALKGAEAVQNLQKGEYWLKRSEQERNQWKIDPKTGTMYNTINGQSVAKAPTAKDRYDIAIALHATPEEALQYSLNGKLTEAGAHNPNQYDLYLKANNNDPRAALSAMNQDKIAQSKALRDSRTDPEYQDLRKQKLVEDMSRAKDVDIDRVNNKKSGDERNILDHHRIELAQLYARTPQPNPAQINEINAKYANQLQNVQNQYAQDLRRRGIDGVVDQDVKANLDTGKIEWAPRVPAAPGGAPGAAQTPPVAVPPAAAAPPVVPVPRAPSPPAAPPPAAHPGQIKMIAPDGKTVLTFESPEQQEAFIQKYGLAKK